MIWLIFLGIMIVYGLGVAVTQRIAVRSWFKEAELKWPDRLNTPEDYANNLDIARDDMMFIALLWPVMWVPLLWEGVARGSMETDRLKRLRAEAELEKVKTQARELGMSFPDA